MKKAVLFLVVMTFASSGCALVTQNPQFAEKMLMMVSGDRTTVESSYSGYSSTSADISIGGDGVMFVDNRLGYGGTARYEGSIGSGYNSYLLMLGPRVMYTFELTDYTGIVPYVTGALGLAIQDSSSMDSETGSFIELGIGALIFFQSNVAVNLFFNLDMVSLGDYDYDVGTLGGGLAILFGPE